jgi:hypothetical protein
MATIAAQLRKLRKLINIPYTIKFVDHKIDEADFEDKVIYVHIWIKGKGAKDE